MVATQNGDIESDIDDDEERMPDLEDASNIDEQIGPNRFAVSVKGIEVDSEKVKAIESWPKPKSVGDDGRSIACFSEKLNKIALNYPTYDKEMYALVRSLETWQHYFWPKELVIHKDHESLKNLKGQNKLNKRHAKWSEFIESFPYKIKYNFEHIKEIYEHDYDFGNVFNACEIGAFDKFYRHDGFLFKEKCLCIPICSIREVLVREAHKGGLIGHIGIVKILDVLHDIPYWPNMK
eukprot:XP_015574129.1 uncharacterized protein LOC107261186 [Ricinus communis]